MAKRREERNSVLTELVADVEPKPDRPATTIIRTDEPFALAFPPYTSGGT